MDDHANHEGVEAARKAAEAYLASHGGAPGPVEVLSAQTQVVAGAWGQAWRAGQEQGGHSAEHGLECCMLCMGLVPPGRHTGSSPGAPAGLPSPLPLPLHPLPPAPGTNYKLKLKAGSKTFDATVWGERGRGRSRVQGPPAGTPASGVQHSTRGVWPPPLRSLTACPPSPVHPPAHCVCREAACVRRRV